MTVLVGTEAPTRASLNARKRTSRLFAAVSFVSTIIGLAVLLVLVVDVFIRGVPSLNWEFLTSFPSRFPERAGILSAIVGTIWIMSFTAAFAFPIGVGAAIYLEEYAPRNWLTTFIEVNIGNLAGVPSVIYGLLGLEVFVRIMQLERSVLAGSLTMSLLILPIVIIASREALRAVPPSLREGAYALGATQWQVVRRAVLPVAFPGILTGTILALSRAIGETAPLITIGALTFIAFLPEGPLSPFTVLPIQIFNWVSRPQSGFHERAAAGIIVLLVVLLLMNGTAVWLRSRFQKRAV